MEIDSPTSCAEQHNSFTRRNLDFKDMIYSITAQENVHMLKLIITFLFLSLLVACGSGGGGHSSTSQSASTSSASTESFVPASLKNTKITLNETAITIASTGTKQTSSDITILNFDDSRLTVKASDGRTLPSIYGYGYTTTNNLMIVSSVGGYGDGYKFELTYKDNKSGSYKETYTGFDEVVNFVREGNFTLQDEPFSFLPENVVNNVYHLNFKTAESALTVEESPIVGENFEMNFFKDNHLITKPSNLLPQELDANYSITPVDSFTLEINGVYSGTKHTYKLTAHFDSLRTGTFTLNIDDGKAVATGDFDTIKITPINKSSMKGNFVGVSSITSVNTQITYPYNVYLPPNYQTSGKNYPVIYVTDGQWYFGFAYLLDKKSKDVIMVSIDQGPINRRMIDFLPDGAPLYTKFLKEELIPLIESTYRTNSERTFTGVSAGGLLGAYLLSVEPTGVPYFKNYILIDGAFFAVTPAVIAAEQTRFTLDKSLAINVLLAGSPQGNAWFVNAFEQRYKNRNYSNFQIFNKEFRVSHDEMGPLAFDDLIDRIY